MVRCSVSVHGELCCRIRRSSFLGEGFCRFYSAKLFGDVASCTFASSQLNRVMESMSNSGRGGLMNRPAITISRPFLEGHDVESKLPNESLHIGTSIKNG